MKTLFLGSILLFSVAAVAQHPMKEMMQDCPMASMMGSFDVKYEATPAGATLTFTPKDPAELGELQAKVRQMAEQMKKMHGERGGMRRAK